MLLMLDNYDSFTYNLVHYFQELGVEVKVERNDAISLEEIAALAPTYIVISPGPCTPNETGISLDVVKHFAGKIPILGVCLGHQCIGQVFGAQVVRAKQVMHGKTSLVAHQQTGLFAGLHNPLEVTRYHSLVIDPKTMPDELEVTAWSLDKDHNSDVIMAIQHKHLPIVGVQFHPESVMTQQGHDLLANFLSGCYD